MNIQKEWGKDNIAHDFTIKLQEGTVNGYQAYYELVLKDGIEFSTGVAEHRALLKAIEDSEKARVKDLPPLKPMLETLKEYMVETESRPLDDEL